MLIQDSIHPSNVSIITTFKCTSACSNCCFECGPKRKDKLPLDKAIANIDNTICHFTKIRVAVLTGGECFIDLDYLLALIRHVHTYNLVCRVVTNGFWASSKENALNILTQCKKAGLNEINFSTGDDHLEFVPLENIINGIEVSVNLGLTVVVNIESGKDRRFNISEFIKDQRISKYLNPRNSETPRLSVINGMWMPFTRESINFLPTLNPELYHPCMDRCKNLFGSITISPNNRLLACCGLPVLYIKYLDLGNIEAHSIPTLYNKQFDDFIKIWLFVDGPYKILTFIEKKINSIVPERRVMSHICFYCAALFTNPIYIQTVKQHYKEIFHSVMLRYALLIKQLNKSITIP
ncbi:MAG: hypothetical protein NC095_10215 [Muribaculum sp.]|nr:hypothetical protein [Muribaculum sp.]